MTELLEITWKFCHLRTGCVWGYTVTPVLWYTISPVLLYNGTLVQ